MTMQWKEKDKQMILAFMKLIVQLGIVDVVGVPPTSFQHLPP